MDRQAFKQRMQNLKSYQENNPGKGYWDWKVQAYENAGETGDDRTDHPVAQRIELEKQIELANYIDKINHTDKNGDYNPFYSSVDDTYGTVELPTVQVTAPLTDMVASGRLQAKPFAEERFNKTGVGAEPNEFDLWVNTGMYRDPMQLANHEMNHYTDYIISRNANTTINNNMLKQLENSLKQTDATSYY